MAESTNETASISTRGWSSRKLMIVTTIATVGICLASMFAAFVYLLQVRVMDQQLEQMERTVTAMQDQQRMARKPLLKMHLHKDLEKGSVAGYVSTDEGGERWELPYFLLNIGETPAYDIRYWHAVSTDSALSTPDTSAFQKRWSDNLLFPDEFTHCGADPLLRQVWIDSNKVGVPYFRHFAVFYRDEFDNLYGYRAVWRIIYEQDKPLGFISVTYQPITPSPSEKQVAIAERSRKRALAP